jgi:putative phosphoserine phosphatase/1-acylglycerol-3-phosphate O-acyltransferase
VVFIDRSNAKSAIESIAPLVDAMRNEGKSVVLAPEGTRTVSPRLAPFKKGAFHIAMQAGVPMIPIVIRNAGDVAPKGDFIFRSATVDVEVLPPVDTSEWTRSTLDQHVAEVRNIFARALGQPEEAVPALRPGVARQLNASKTASKKKSSPDKKKSATKKKAAAAKRKASAGGKPATGARKATASSKKTAGGKSPAAARPRRATKPKTKTKTKTTPKRST